MADHYDSTSGLTLTASRADLLKTLAQSRPRSYGAGDTFLTVPYRPILARLDCHAWLSVRRPERRVGARYVRRFPGQREIRARPHRGRWAPASSGGAAGRSSPHGRAAGWPRPARTSSSRARVSLTRALCSPGGNRPAGRRMTWTAAVQPMLQSAASAGESQKDQPERARGSRYLSWSRSAPAVPVLPRQETGRPPGSRWMRLGEVVCQS